MPGHGSRPGEGRYNRELAAVFAAALLLFAPSITTFAARVTDVSALRLLEGDVPYRDFWTMYAPGSFTAVALAFAVFGRELMVSNALGIITSAAAVTAYYRVAREAGGVAAARILAALVAIAFLGTGYHDGFTSYPPAFLLILMAVNRAIASIAHDGWRWAVVPGLLLGLAAVFKHDVAGYATLAVAAAIVVARYRGALPAQWTPALVLTAAAGAVVGSAVIALLSVGAIHDAWDQLVVFPMTDFKHVRPEFFPILPRLGDSVISTAQSLVHWSICNLPTVALVAGLVGLRRRWPGLEPRQVFIGVCAFVAFWLHWSAAHVQLNTNAISLAAWAGLVAALGLARAGQLSPRALRLGAAFVVVWGLALTARPLYLAATAGAAEWVQLPRLAGIRAPAADVHWMRRLAAAMAETAPPDAPLQLVGNRNDVVIFAAISPYWLSPRRPASRHHELHPGITDTARVQRAMLDRLQRAPAPVIVREHRFDDEALDQARTEFRRNVDVGATLLDDWLRQHYETRARFGPYELMQRTAAAPE